MQLRVRKRRPKRSGILLPLSALPSNYGIGTLGDAAYDFIDFLERTNQSYWQLLPLCPLGKGNSPYSSYSSFAGEPLYIDLDILVCQGYLKKSDIKEIDFPEKVDFDLVRSHKMPILLRAAAIFDTNRKDFKEFKRINETWLSDYALFMAISEVSGTKDFTAWSDGLKYRLPKDLNDFKEKYAEKILFHEILQYFFYSQFKRLKSYATAKGIKLIGDIPFYVSLESADIWSEPQYFKLGRDMTPVLVAGVPPDVFSKDGQLWGNPIYDWKTMRQNDYLWWKKRLGFNASLYDVIRIDHFRAFCDYYTIPYGSKNAKSGNWEKGEGMQFWNSVKPIISKTEIIAEDLGGESQEVQKLISDTAFPNMKVLQFAFDSDLKDPFLPKNMNSNCVCYTGTHDNDTTLGWFNKATEKEKIIFSKLVPDVFGSVALNLIYFGMKSRAETVIIPLQDYLELDSNARTNTPGTEKNNWTWRAKKEDFCDDLAEKIKKCTFMRN